MKKHKVYDLIGRVVMIDPSIKLNDDSSKSGIVVSVLPEKELANVKFDNGEQADCDVKKLITLSPKAMIMQHLANNWEISPLSFRASLKICKLISRKQFSEALRYAVSDATTQSICTVSCGAWLELKTNKNNRKGLSR